MSESNNTSSRNSGMASVPITVERPAHMPHGVSSSTNDTVEDPPTPASSPAVQTATQRQSQVIVDNLAARRGVGNEATGRDQTATLSWARGGTGPSNLDFAAPDTRRALPDSPDVNAETTPSSQGWGGVGTSIGGRSQQEISELIFLACALTSVFLLLFNLQERNILLNMIWTKLSE